MMRYFSLISLILAVEANGEDYYSACTVSEENPNSNNVPMVNAPNELVGFWEGSNCGLNDPSPVPATLEMGEDGVNLWSFPDPISGELVAQTGDGVESMVGWQCTDVGKGYWWGQVPYSDELWCNLFQVKVVDEVTNSNGTTSITVSYTNLAYGGEGVGAVARGVCPSSVDEFDSSIGVLQASFTRRIDNMDSVEFMSSLTCNQESSSLEIQRNCHSRFPHYAVNTYPLPYASAISPTMKWMQDNAFSLPVIDEDTCKITVPSSTIHVFPDLEDIGDVMVFTLPYSSAASSQENMGLTTILMIAGACVILITLVTDTADIMIFS